jgi:hypothetical protein
MGKSAGQEDQIDVGHVGVTMPDHDWRGSDRLFQRDGGVSVAVGAGENDDGSFHATISIE